MQRDLARSVSHEMAVLGVVEWALSFMVIYAMMQTAGMPGLEVAAAIPGFIENLPSHSLGSAVALTLTIGTVAVAIGLYRPAGCLDRTRLLIATGISSAIALAALVVLAGGLRQGFTAAHAVTVARILGAWLLTIALIRLAFRFTLVRRSLSRRVLLLGDTTRIAGLSAMLRSRRGRGFDPVVLHASDVSWPLLRQQRIGVIVVASQPDDAAALDTLLDCKLRGMHILSGVAFQEQHLGRIDLDGLTPAELVVADGFVSNRLSVTMKRASDIGIAVAMLVMTLPLMLLTALAIKADSPGPMLYRQQRIGQFGTLFTVFKFRSMTADAEAGGTPCWAQSQDPRVTRVGRFIRATRIDELPQLANVIGGHMSLVGPRPERPHFVQQLTQAIPFYHQRSYVKPGLTGWAQVNYPYGASVEDAREKLAYDLYYVKHRSLVLDLTILLSTIPVVLFREGAR